MFDTFFFFFFYFMIFVVITILLCYNITFLDSKEKSFRDLQYYMGHVVLMAHWFW